MENDDLNQLADRIGKSTDRLVGTGNRLVDAIESSARGQKKQQRAIVGLTWIIAISTFVYAVVTVLTAIRN